MTKRALVVGINEYPNRPLSCCNDDAEEIAGVLKMPEYEFDVRTLIDQQATRRNILSELAQLFDSTASVALFYFAGHGFAADTGAYIAPIDTDNIDIGIDLDYLSRLINARSSNNSDTIIILDCCHSGSANFRGLSSETHRHLFLRDLENLPIILQRRKVLIAACKPNELAYEEPSLRHGMFTHYLLEGLYGDAADHEGKVTATSLYDHVSQQFEERVGQTPVFKGDMAGRLIIGSNLSPRTKKLLPDQQEKELIRTARQFVNEYVQKPPADIDGWRSSRYREACSSLQPVLDWLDKQCDQHPQLARHPQFSLSYSTARGKLAELARLEEGFNTREGTAVKRLGAGTFGAVWKLLNSDGKELAYKVYHPVDLDDKDKLARFNRGYRAMEQLDHPHIVRVHKFTRCPVGFTMDFINGPNLRDFASASVDAIQLIEHLLVIGETLQHSHSRNVIHRDVKPENIIMSWDANKQQYRPYLTDFDLSWFSTATQFTREALGSLIYAAPEQLAKPNSRQAHEPTTDIYAFGQLCFFALTRRDPVPILSNNGYALAEELRNTWLEEPARLFIELYNDCTQDEPGKRVQHFREVCDRLFEISTLLKASDHKRIIGFEAFTRQLMFSIVGMAPEMIFSDTSFRTASGRTTIDVSSKAHDVIFRFESITQLAVNVSTHKEARDQINVRIDNVLGQFRPMNYRCNATRHTGNQGIYETYIHFHRLPLSVDGVELCRPILMRIIDCIERA